jgi:hypothetical protein
MPVSKQRRAAMRLLPGFRALGRTRGTSGHDFDMLSSVPTHHRHRGRRLMRQMLIAAAIAAGLVALWAALLPLAA